MVKLMVNRMQPVQPDLLGYVLNALDAPSRAYVEAYLLEHPAAQMQVLALREALEPLSWDPAAAPPPELAERTVQHVEEEKGVETLFASNRVLTPLSRRLLEVAAVLLVTATAAGVGIAWLGGLHGQRAGGAANPVLVTACKDNMHSVFAALSSYGDIHGKKGQFPDVAKATKTSRNTGGLVFSVLHDNELLPVDFKLACPGTACPSPDHIGLAEVETMNEMAFQGWTQTMQYGYAYSLGYRQGGQLMGPRLEDGKPSAQLPLLADSSPPDPLQGTHSLNHGGSGQNVLYYDGHIAFCPSRYVGYNLDDIYLNRANKVAAGVDWTDAVLTSGVVPP
jgi:prepilin-type processing-associated H-X9-DG protein